MLIIFCCLIVLIGFAINLPVFISVLTSVLTYFYFSDGADMVIAAQRVIGASENPTLLAIPFFILLGNLLNYTGITRRLLKLAEILTGHFRGGLAQSNILLSTMMGGLSASNLADCAMLCKMLVPQMVRQGYSKAFSTVVTAFGSLITPIIPPGIALIIYGFVANVSIGKMFLAGIIPGILCAFLLMLTIYIIARIKGYKASRDHGPTLIEFWAAFKDATTALILIIGIIGGVRFGVFTPTEAGAIAVIYLIFVGLFIHKEMTITHILSSLIDTAKATATVMIIIMTCSAFAWILSWEQLSQGLAIFITGLSSSPIVFLLLLSLFLLFLGMFIEGNALLIVLVPLLMPTVKQLGIDPIHFGIVIILNLAIGCITPPLGTVMFMANSITGTTITEFIKAMWPLFLTMIFALMLIIFFPFFSTFLAHL